MPPPVSREPQRPAPPRPAVAPPSRGGLWRVPFRWCRSLISAVVVLAVLLCLAEIGLRVYDSHTGQLTRCEMYDVGPVAKSRFCHHELKPLFKTTLPPVDGGEPVEIETNSFGLRGPEPVLPKPSGTFRIVCLGDDRTSALDTPADQTFCAILQEHLQSRSQVPIEVWNAGIPDACPLLSYLQYRQRLSGLQADLVLVNFDMSDVWDDYHLRPCTRLGSDNQPLVAPHPQLEPRASQPQCHWAELFLLPQVAKQKLGRLWAGNTLAAPPAQIDSPTGKYLWLLDQPPDWSISIRQTFAPLKSLRGLAEGQFAELAVAALPAPWQVSAQASDGEGVRAAVGITPGVMYRSTRPFDLLYEYCTDEHLPYCDALEAFQDDRRGADLFHQNAPTLSAAGHELYARVLAGFILQELNGPWRATAPRNAVPRSDAPVQLQGYVAPASEFPTAEFRNLD